MIRRSPRPNGALPSIPTLLVAISGLADVLNIQVKPTEALVAVEKAMRLDPRNADNYLFEQGWAYTRAGTVERSDSRSQALSDSLSR